MRVSFFLFSFRVAAIMIEIALNKFDVEKKE